MRTENLMNLLNVVRTTFGDDWFTYNTNQDETETLDDMLMLSSSIEVSYEDGEYEVYGSYIVGQIHSIGAVGPIRKELEEALVSEDDFSYNVVVFENTSPFKHENYIAVINVGSFYKEEV